MKSCIEDIKYKKAFETLSKNHINLINITSESLYLLVYKIKYEPLDKPIDKPVLNIHLKGLKESVNNLEKLNKKFTNMEAFFNFSSPKINGFYAAQNGLGFLHWFNNVDHNFFKDIDTCNKTTPPFFLISLKYKVNGA